MGLRLVRQECYWLHYLGDGHVIGWDDFCSDSDESAITHAFELRGGCAAELWQGHRRIWIFDALPEQLLIDDPLVEVADARDETRHLYTCDHCGQAVDRRRVADVFHHAEPEHDPLPAHDRDQTKPKLVDE